LQGKEGQDNGRDYRRAQGRTFIQNEQQEMRTMQGRKADWQIQIFKNKFDF
jgi:hypothetical protein